MAMKKRKKSKIHQMQEKINVLARIGPVFESVSEVFRIPRVPYWLEFSLRVRYCPRAEDSGALCLPNRLGILIWLCHFGKAMSGSAEKSPTPEQCS